MKTTCIDWDDTLFPSSYIDTVKIKTSYDLMFTFQRLLQYEKIVCEILELILEKSGKVIIISGASEDWILSSSKLYIPRILPLLEKCDIISARDLYAQHFPGNIRKWKALAFDNFVSKETTELISLGDSIAEREAALKVGNIRGIRVKTVKFIPNPDLDGLIIQLEFLTRTYEEILEKADSMDMMLTMKQVC